jgi:hypothetical protein
MTQQDLSQYDDGTGDADLREGLRRCREVNGQALASLASGEPTATEAATGGKPQQPSGVRQLRPGWFLGVDKVDGIDREAWTLLRTQPDGTHKVIASGYIEQATGGKE